MNGRNFLDFTLLTPGVVRDPTRSGDISFGGQRGTSNSLLVDGADSNNTFYGQSTGRAGTGRSPYSFSEDAVEEFQVNTNNYAAEIGRAGGGVINTITKSGTNGFHGDGFWFFRDKALNANSWDNNALGRPKRAYHFNQFGGNVGGPIVRDKAFFFFSYDGQKNKTPNTVALGVQPAATDTLGLSVLPSLQQYLVSYANSLNNNVYLGKVDWTPSTNQHVTFRYNANRFTGINYENSGATSAVGHTGNSSVNTDNVGAIYSYAMGANKVWRRVSSTRRTMNRERRTPPRRRQSFSRTATAISFGRNSFSPRSANIDTYQPTASLSWIKGAHSFKFGADFIFQQIANFFPGNFEALVPFYLDSATCTEYFLPSSLQADCGPPTAGGHCCVNVPEYAVPQNKLVFRATVINYGVRYDYFSYAQPPVLNSDPTLLAANIRTNRINRDGTNVGPRIGLAYSPDANGKMVVRAGYGIFYAVTPSIFTGTAFTQNGIQVQSFGSTNAAIPVTYPNLLPGIPTTARTPSLFVFASDFKNPQVQQWNFQVERQFGGNFAVTLGYLGTKGSHLPRTRDINLSPAIATTPVLGGGTFTYYRHHFCGRTPIMAGSGWPIVARIRVTTRASFRRASDFRAACRSKRRTPGRIRLTTIQTRRLWYSAPTMAKSCRIMSCQISIAAIPTPTFGTVLSFPACGLSISCQRARILYCERLLMVGAYRLWRLCKAAGRTIRRLAERRRISTTTRTCEMTVRQAKGEMHCAVRTF